MAHSIDNIVVNIRGLRLYTHSIEGNRVRLMDQILYPKHSYEYDLENATLYAVSFSDGRLSYNKCSNTKPMVHRGDEFEKTKTTVLNYSIAGDEDVETDIPHVEFDPTDEEQVYIRRRWSQNNSIPTNWIGTSAGATLGQLVDLVPTAKDLAQNIQLDGIPVNEFPFKVRHDRRGLIIPENMTVESFFSRYYD